MYLVSLIDALFDADMSCLPPPNRHSWPILSLLDGGIGKTVAIIVVDAYKIPTPPGEYFCVEPSVVTHRFQSRSFWISGLQFQSRGSKWISNANILSNRLVGMVRKRYEGNA